ncbi:lon protease homolog 2, peroxisomal-like [Adelges cooleyi]|uniref:lon protease homolog 2, peroxisomal-like n=1 Tax=Adelges cooleyi TaxID=133065 RepID=UPI0021802AF0|nr:lon protease homolog 2, peroxisomal-like [Adelges cooleyi]
MTTDIPKQLPIVFITPILIPGYILKIQLPAEENNNLLKHLLDKDKNNKLSNFIGVIPKADYEKESNVIGAIGLIQSIIKFDNFPKEYILIVQGICRFKLGPVIIKEPLLINEIEVIENYKELIGDEKEKIDLQDDFKKAFIDLLSCLEMSIVNPSIQDYFKKLFNSLVLHQALDYCLKTFIQLTPANAYEILQAPNLNKLLTLVTDWLKEETIKNIKSTKRDKTGLVPIRSTFPINSGSIKIIEQNHPHDLKNILKLTKNSNIPKSVHDVILRELDSLKHMTKSNPEYSIVFNYVSFIVNLPWGKFSDETLDLTKTRKILQDNHYGMCNLKQRILHSIAVRKFNPNLQGLILCFCGPPGIGKTTIAKSIAKSLNRKFQRVSLGGINDQAEIKGHRRTYIGALPGRIMHAINKAQTMNPVILLDEIDKMHKGSSGDPAAALLEVLDPEQNNSFVDSYTSLPFDLSQVLFVATANKVTSIPQTLRDRLEIIYLKGYTEEEKLQIAENYLIPKVLKDHKMENFEIIIYKETLRVIIKKYTYETGVRELQRKIETICQSIAMKIVENSDEKFNNFIITPESLQEILGTELLDSHNEQIALIKTGVGIALGLAWTPFGGKLQVIESSRFYSKGKKNQFIITGLAGQTLKESVAIGLHWIQSFTFKNKIDIDQFNVHIHLPSGALKKDGPSAGVPIVCALVSLFWNIALKPTVAMTGEISLNGHVLGVGGIKEKILAAYDSDIKTVIIPESNMKDTESLSQEIKDMVNIIPIRHLEEMLEYVIPGGLTYLQDPLNILKSKF